MHMSKVSRRSSMHPSESSEQTCVRTDCDTLLLIILLGARENPAQQTLNAADNHTANTECSRQ